MLSMNEFQESGQNFQLSERRQNESYSNSLKKDKNYINMSLLDSQSNNRQLFRKCKQIIQQQMLQINRLSQQNEKLSCEIKQKEQESRQKQHKIKQLLNENQQNINKNEILHKELNKVKKNIEEMNAQIINKSNVIKLKQNQLQLLEESLKKTKVQRNYLQEKCIVLEQTVELMKKELNKAQNIIQLKDNEIKSEICELKKVKSILQKNNLIQSIDQMLIINQKENQLKFSDQKHNKTQIRPYFTVPEETPFNQINLNQYANPYQKRLQQLSQKIYNNSAHIAKKLDNKSKNVSPFSIVDQRSNTSPVSRIRKNISKPKTTYDTDIHCMTKNSISKSKKRQHFTQKFSQTKNDASFIKNVRSQSFNPQISQELSSIKKQILNQYNRMEIKKGMISHDRINQTLQQIENKLQKMVKISAMDQSQSQLQ